MLTATVASSPIWLLNTWNGVAGAEEQVFHFYLTAAYLRVSLHGHQRTAVLDNIALRVVL